MFEGAAIGLPSVRVRQIVWVNRWRDERWTERVAAVAPPRFHLLSGVQLARTAASFNGGRV
jgi:hypothetical protein